MSPLSGTVAELLGVAFYGTVAAVLTIVGGLAEWASVQDLLAGQAIFGAWELAMGMVLIYAGYNVAQDLVIPRLRDVRSSA